MSNIELINLDADAFKKWITTNEGIVIFHKKLCPHCKVMRTVLGKVKAQMPGIALAAIDSEEQPNIMEEVGVEHVPTLCVIKGGKVRATKTGVFNPKETMAFYNAA